jgi:hypothetical protein
MNAEPADEVGLTAIRGTTSLQPARQLILVVQLEEKTMKAMLFALFIVCAVNAGEPSIVFDNRPEAGVPREALTQKLKLTAQEELLATKDRKFHALNYGTIKTVRIRYFNKETWKSEKEAREYVAGFLGNKSSAVFGFQIWSQGVGVPEIECIVEFTDEHRKKLLAENKECREGRLLIWNTESCFRDATGRWFFVDAFDQFHRSHPKGNRENAKGAKSK